MKQRRLEVFLGVLAILIVGLMALGAGVRAMNAGLSCPDWPLCFGKIVPDFHVGVWFEFVHRAYAGLVSLLFGGAVFVVLRSKSSPIEAKTAAKWGAFFLALQILMGGLTVLLLVKAVIVTGHLLLATLFFSSVLWMFFSVRAERVGESSAREGVRGSPFGSAAVFFPLVVFVQIAVGGLVASTYSGSVCVDWPLCNGEWVPTLAGAIGLQIVHRFIAYGLVAFYFTMSIITWFRRNKIPASIAVLFYWSGAVVSIQTVVGILNLLKFIPPEITVPHQTLAILLYSIQLRIWFLSRRGPRTA